jgi:hypothetical protein
MLKMFAQRTWLLRNVKKHYTHIHVASGHTSVPFDRNVCPLDDWIWLMSRP